MGKQHLRALLDWGVAVWWLAVMLILLTAIMRAAGPPADLPGGHSSPIRMVGVEGARPSPPPTVYELSFWAAQGAVAADLISSYGVSRGRADIVEMNPFVIGTQDGRFTARTLAIQSGIAVGLAVVQRLVVRRWPRSRKAFTILNLGQTGAHVWAAQHNWRLE